MNVLERISTFDSSEDSVPELIREIEKEWSGDGFSFEKDVLKLKSNGLTKNEEIINALKLNKEFWALFHEEDRGTGPETVYEFRFGEGFLFEKETHTDLTELRGIYTTEDILKEFFEESYAELEKLENINQFQELVKKLFKGEIGKDMPKKILELKEQTWRKL